MNSCVRSRDWVLLFRQACEDDASVLPEPVWPAGAARLPAFGGTFGPRFVILQTDVGSRDQLRTSLAIAASSLHPGPGSLILLLLTFVMPEIRVSKVRGPGDARTACECSVKPWSPSEADPV